MTEPPTPAEELKAMTRIVTALEPLDPDTRRRTVAWITDRYGKPATSEEGQ